MTRRRDSWPEPHDVALKTAIEKGCTFTQAAAVLKDLFGIVYSRSAVGGRASRLKIRADKVVTPEKALRSLEIARASRHAPKHPPRPKPKAKPPMPQLKQFTCEPVTGLREADIEPLHIALVDLEPNQCRWPYGPPYSFCGHWTFPGSSYCEVHAALSLGRGTASERDAHRVSTKQAA